MSTRNWLEEVVEVGVAVVVAEEEEDLTVREWEWEWWRDKGKERVVGVSRRVEYLEEEERERVGVEGDADKFKDLAIVFLLLLYWALSSAAARKKWRKEDD